MKRGRDEHASKECLPLYGEGVEEDDDEGPPMDGYAFLRRGRKQVKKGPGTVVAKNREEILGEVVERKRERFLEVALVPGKDWRLATLAQFRAMREKYETLRPATLPPLPHSVPKTRDSKEWKAFCFGGRRQEPHTPTLPLLLSLEQVTISWLVVCHKNWLSNSPAFPPTRAETPPLPGKQDHHLRMAHQAQWGSGEGGSIAWLYTLLVCLEEPLVPADQTALAELLWSLCQLWTQIDAWGWTGRAAKTENPPSSEGLDVDRLVGLVATMVTVIHCHFKQGSEEELWVRDVV